MARFFVLALCMFGFNDKLTVDFGRTKEPSEFQAFIAKQIFELSESELASIVAIGDDTSSLCASWQRVLNSKSEELKVRRLEQMLGIINARVSAPPNWWKNVVRTVKLNESKLSQFSRPEISIDLRKTYPEEDQGMFVLKNENAVFLIARDVSVVKESSSIDYLLTANSCYSIQHADTCFSFNIERHDNRAKSPAWRSRVWASGNLFDISGPSWHITELREIGDDIVVFGAANHCVYVEAFDKKSGKCKSRFSTVYFVHELAQQ